MNFEEFVLNFMENIGDTDFSSVGKYFGIGFLIFWIAIVWWVWFDASERTTKTWARIASIVLVAVFNVFGLIIYLVIRPDQTIEGTYWEDLERRYMKYETSELGDCPKCGAQLYPGFIYCSNCGYKLKIKCNKCGVFIDRSCRYCPFCRNQIKKETSEEEEVIKAENMEQQVQASKEEIIEVVESDKTRYSKKESIITKIGESIIGGYKIMFRKTGKNNGVNKKRMGKKKVRKKKKGKDRKK